jgi:hypothetical protein
MITAERKRNLQNKTYLLCTVHEILLVIKEVKKHGTGEFFVNGGKLGELRQSREDIIKIDFKRVGYKKANDIHVPWDRDQMLADVNTELICRVWKLINWLREH